MYSYHPPIVTTPADRLRLSGGSTTLDNLAQVLALRPANNGLRLDPLPALPPTLAGNPLTGAGTTAGGGPGGGAFRAELSYYLYDHLGHTRVVFHTTLGGPASPAYGPEFLADYYPYGRILRQWNPCQEERYLTTHHERDAETGYDYRGARYYDADLGRFLAVDPLAGEYGAWSPYNYVLGNPISLIDPDGMAPDDYYYDQDGKFLYRDSRNTDYIRIVDNSSINGVYPRILAYQDEERTQFLDNYFRENSTLVSNARISARAWSNITTGILASMDDINMSLLYNGSVSVLNHNTRDQYNDPLNFASLANVDPEVLAETGQIKISTYLWSGSADIELNTVSQVKNVLGAHEFLGHGIMRYTGRDRTHHKAYELQMNHPSWESTTEEFKQLQIGRYNDYMAEERR